MTIRRVLALFALGATVVLFAAGCGSSSSSTADASLDITNSGQDTNAPGDLISSDAEVDTAPDTSGPQIPCEDINGNLVPQACPSAHFCNKSGVCQLSREAGQRCDSMVHAKLTDDSACKVGFCKAGPFKSAAYCVNLKETCGSPEAPTPDGSSACSDDEKESRICTGGKWGQIESCTNSSCDDGQGKFVNSCKPAKGCVLQAICSSCFPGRFDGDSADCDLTCKSDNDCSTGAECDQGQCVKSAKKLAGQSCTSAADCQTGLFCVRALDKTGTLQPNPSLPGSLLKICCKNDCSSGDAPCRGCNPEGHCANVGATKTDPLCPSIPAIGDINHKPCRQNGTCDGLGNCATWPAGEICSEPSCSCDPAGNKDNCQQRKPSTCDAQSNCIQSDEFIACPKGLGCNGNRCNYGSCTEHSQCELTGFEGTLFCGKSGCEPRLAALGICFELSVKSLPYDDSVCNPGLVCLKHNFGGNSGGRCGDSSNCIGPDGNSQLPVGTVRCAADNTPWQCSPNPQNSSKPEWSKLAACSTVPKGCQLIAGDDNSGVRPGQICQAPQGCVDAECQACPKNTRFDAGSGKCLDSCSKESDCPSTYRCNLKLGACVAGSSIGESCHDDGSSPNYKPCRIAQDGKALHCTQNRQGQSICCYESCDGPCRFCQPTGLDNSPLYQCENRPTDYKSPACNQGSGICGKQTGYCDGQGVCALPGSGTRCDSNCVGDQFTPMFCDTKGNCSVPGQTQTCEAGCQDTGECNEAKCETHDTCPEGFYCSSSKVCEPRLTKGARCEAKSYKTGSTPEADFDDKTCVSGLRCSPSPAHDKGFCTESEKCSINASTVLEKGQHFCDPTHNLIHLCQKDSNWTNSECIQQETSCDQDANTQYFQGYRAPASCSKEKGCQPSPTCTKCPGRLRYTGQDQPNYDPPCHFGCHCKPVSDVSIEPTGLCPVGYIFAPDDTRCWQGLWCGKNPADPSSGHQCRDKLTAGSRCDDVQQPTRQCENSKCCPTQLGNGQTGELYCSTCCSDNDCTDEGSYCDVKQGGCVKKQEPGSSCNRDDECKSQVCCNSICSTCCSSYSADCQVADNCCPFETPWCNEGVCEGDKFGGTSCTCKNGVSCDECKSKTCVDGLCTCSSDKECPESKYCEASTCKDKKQPGDVCDDSSECTSGVCCKNANDTGHCSDECCADSDCDDDKFCDNIKKKNSVQTHDGLSYRCLLKRVDFGGCVEDAQCESGDCLNSADTKRDGYFCGECRVDADCDIVGGLFSQCCNGVCRGLLAKCSFSCEAGQFKCGPNCCYRQTEYCSGNGSCKARLTNGQQCLRNDQLCISGHCDRNTSLCVSP